MKKIFAAALAVCMTISLAACGSSTQTAGTDTASTGSAVTGIDDLPERPSAFSWERRVIFMHPIMRRKALRSSVSTRETMPFRRCFRER